MFNRTEKIFAGIFLIVSIIAGALGYPFSGTTPTPKKTWFDTTAGDVIFDHGYHEPLSACEECHHDYNEKDTSSDPEMNCRACHYFGNKPEVQSGDDTHKRYIGANCTDCHKVNSLEEDCES